MPYTDYNWITDRLAIGALVSDSDHDFPFDAVLSMETHAPATLGDLARREHIDYQWRSIIDGFSYEDNDEIVRRFDAAAAQINDWIGHKERVLVHCTAGVSRSVTAVIWYLMRYEGYSWDDAYALIRAERPQANPNIRFEIPLRLASGESLSPERIEQLIAGFIERVRPYDVDITVDEVRQELEEQGSISPAGSPT